jgi:N-glycosylase/DNA lyase
MIATEEKTVRLAGADELDIVKTFECGQCFRWNADGDGVYTGAAFGTAARLRTENGAVYIDTDDMTPWRDYFDLDTDYDAVSRGFMGISEYMDRCVGYGRGIRILRQDRWEALCSFIISQCNNIPRIKGIVERLCACFGEPLEFRGEILYSFPSAQTLAPLTPEDLAPLRCGYRAPYIIDAARLVADGGLDLEALSCCCCGDSLKALKSINGVGDKVANCANLFGLGHLEAFPVDVWMKRALREHFPPDFDPAVFGENAGLAQQYIFYYARSGGE